MEKDGILIIAEGPALVKDYVKNKTEKLDEVVDKKVLDTNQLARLRQVFTVPPSSLRDNDNFYADKRRGFRGVRVCRPPHVIVGAARNFAIYSNKYIIVPPRQIGIASATGDKHFLKALSLYLSSDFAFYHQFLTSTQFGVQRGRATLDALRRMPIALDPSNHKAMRAWSSLHKRMSRLKPVQMAAEPSQPNETPLFPTMYEQDEEVGDVLKELNDMVFDALRLDESERALVSDLVRVRMALNDGKVGKVAIEPPAHKEVCAYARRLRIELDDFIGDEVTSRHAVSVVYDGLSGMIQTELNADKSGEIVLRANTAAANELESTRSRLRNKRAQWVYFDRSLRIYEGTRTFLFKPMQRFHWTESQAMIDARQIIKETIALEGVE